jgi:glycosyltransferase involved in cell wall biosynthesis
MPPSSQSTALGRAASLQLPRPLRVVRLYHHLEVGGIEGRLVDLLPRLDRSLFHVQVVCTRRRGLLAALMEERGIPVRVCRHYSRLPLPWSTLPLARLLRRLRADLVHGHGELPAQAATVAARRAGVPIIVANFHNVSLFRGPGQLRRERRQAGWRDVVVHVSERALRDYEQRVGPAASRGVVIYNGVDVGRFAAPPDERRSRELREELGLDDDHLVLLNVARLHRDKAHEDLLEALEVVRAAHPRAVLLIVGEGRRRNEIDEEVRRRGLGGAVRLLGLRRDVRDLYHLAHVSVLSSAREGFSNVVLEALAAGVPQVLTDVGGNREAVGDSGAALLVEPGAPAQLAAALVRALDAPELRRAMGRAARERAARFSVDEQVVRTEELYVDLARRKGLAAPGD